MIGGGVRRFVPGLAVLLAYRRSDLPFDVAAGLSVAAVALPVGIAYSEIAGVAAVVGIYSAIFPLFAYALFGSSRQLMTGPDAATCIMAASALAPLAGGNPHHYAALMVVLTLMTGIMYVVAGVSRLGFIADFLSQPILVGYLNGIALIILVGQLPKLCGFQGAGAGFFPQLAEVASRITSTHVPTLLLGGSLLALLVLLQRYARRLPSALIVAAAGIVAVAAFGLRDTGIAVLGAVLSGFPALTVPSFEFGELKPLLRDAAGITLISFTGGILAAKSFARRNRYHIDADQELIAFGACNLASGLAQGFPVTGTNSRTVVNNAMGGRTQLVGVIAGGAMLAFLLFLTGPLALLPKTALAAIIIVSVFDLFDMEALGELWSASGREFAFSLATTAGVLLFGVLPGVLLAVLLSLFWLLSNASRPHDAVLGRAPGVRGFHDIGDYPEAQTISGLLLYRFDANVVFFNCDYLKARVLEEIAAAKAPVEWVVIDASPISIIDYTALQKISELREDLRARGIVLAFARVKQNLARNFRPSWRRELEEWEGHHVYPTLKTAIRAFEQREQTTQADGDPTAPPPSA